MSTILKTLKKLEEEKSVLDQKLDLKEMILKEEKAYPKAVEHERRRFFLIVAMVTAVLIVGGVALNYWAPTHKVSAPSNRIITKTLAQQTPLPERLQKPRTFEGISMEGIPNSEKETMAKPEQALAFFKQLVTTLPAPEPPAPKQPKNNKPLSKLLTKEASSSAVFSDVEEIGRLIQSTTILAKNSPATPATIQSGYIPGVKVKGIIFFDEGSSSNHIIVATSSNSNLKLRMGDPIQNAVLKSIHPNRVIFFYQDQLIEMGIGQ